MTTKVIVQPGRCVRHEGARRFEDAVLYVSDEDLEAWTKSGDVAIPVESHQESTGAFDGNVVTVISATPEHTYDAITNMAQALQEAGLVVAEASGPGEGQEGAGDQPAPDAKTSQADANSNPTVSQPAVKKASSQGNSKANKA